VNVLPSSIVAQDQEWAAAITWFSDRENSEAAAKLTIASVAEDSNDLTRLMHTDSRYADIVQRMVALVIVDVLHRIHERAEDQK